MLIYLHSTNSSEFDLPCIKLSSISFLFLLLLHLLPTRVSLSLSLSFERTVASSKCILNLIVLTFRATLSEDPRSSSARSSGLGPGRPSSLLGLEVVLWWQGVGGSEPLLFELVLYERFAETFLRGRNPSSREISAVRGFAISASSICPYGPRSGLLLYLDKRGDVTGFYEAPRLIRRNIKASVLRSKGMR